MRSEALRRFYYTDAPDLTTKEKQSSDIVRHTREFLEAGGTIDVVPIRIGEIDKREKKSNLVRQLGRASYRAHMDKKAIRQRGKGNESP